MAEPVYIVSGFPRSGTSMLMRALEAGGMSCVYDPSADTERNRNVWVGGYVPNPHGFYEVNDQQNQDWPACRGKAVKVIRDNLHGIRGVECRVVYMTRDPAEIRESFAKVLPYAAGPPDFRFLDGYAAKAAADCLRLASLGWQVTPLDYAAVVRNPARELAVLGWSFDVETAAATIDPALHRHRGAA